MTVPNMTMEEFLDQDPAKLFYTLTSYIYDARKRGALDDVAAVLSVFEPDARRVLLVGSSALLAMDSTTEYSRAIKKALCETLYDIMKGGNEK